MYVRKTFESEEIPYSICRVVCRRRRVAVQTIEGKFSNKKVNVLSEVNMKQCVLFDEKE